MKLDKYHLEVTKTLEERDRLFPIRVPDNNKATVSALQAYIEELNNTEVKGWEPDIELVKSTKSALDSPVFICGFMKSGTTLLLELLDGHNELIVMPGDSHMMNQICKERKTYYADRLIELNKRWVRRLINPTGQSPFWIMGEDDLTYLDFQYYLKYWVKRLRRNSTSLFRSTVASFQCANPVRVSNPRLWVEKTPGNELGVKAINSLLPTSKFIHIIRNPYHNITSLKRLYKIRNWNWDIKHILSMLRKSMGAGVLNGDRLGDDRYLVLSYEELVKNTEDETRKISQFLGIKWEATMLKPTVNGKMATSNSMYSEKRVKGRVSKDLTERWKDELSGEEINIILGECNARSPF